MTGRLLAIVAIVAVVFVIGAQHRQVSSLREEVEQLRREIARNQRGRDGQPLIVPIQGSSPSIAVPPSMKILPEKRSPFRLIESGSSENAATERGMKADEFELKRRQQQWFERQQNPHAPEPIPSVVPPVADHAAPELD